MIERPIHTVLLVDDNPDDCDLVSEAWEEVPLGTELRCLSDGSDLLNYLYRKPPYHTPDSSPRPSVILLDLNMPRLSGGEAISEIRKHPPFSGIPIVILSTSKAPKDICQTASMGVNGYIQKPDSYAGYLQMLTNLRQHWREILERPFSQHGPGNWSGRVAWCS